jgi:threonine/homoserine/homoserine lactone efflux protein
VDGIYRSSMIIFLNGIKFGIILAILVGPVFFTIIQTSIENGFWKGALVAFGVSASDILCILIGYFGVIQFLAEPKFKKYLSYGGGSILIVFGIYTLLVSRRKKDQIVLDANVGRGWFRYVMKGFLMNGLSPSVIIFWITTLSVTAIGFGYSRGTQFLLFFSAVLITVLATDLLKAYLANKLRSIVTPKFIMIMNTLLGIGLIIFGMTFIYRGIIEK